ncbi:trpt1, partial [Symbiodinium pilosum]
VLDSELLQPIQRAEDLPICIHGTYFSKWSPKRKCQVQIWKQIKEEGLKPMGRNHIHFVPHEVGSRTVISGMREDCSIAIYLDVAKTLQKGIKLYRSANDVILTRGDQSGTIPPELFQRVVEIKTGRCLWPVEEPRADECDSDASEQVGNSDSSFHPHVTLAKASRANGKARIPKACWQDFQDTDLGPVVVESLELCRLKGDEGGYYEIEAAVPL